jgi:hypothetical protein
MAERDSLPPLVAEKLAAFDRIEPAFETSFAFVQQVQGARRFASFPVGHTVTYLHALYICDCKDRLLSVPRLADRYDGRRSLEAMLSLGRGEAADTVGLLLRKLDTLPFGEITRQLEAARRDPAQAALAERLAHGRLVLLDRAMNLHRALDALFAASAAELTEQAGTACARYGCTPDEIARRLAALDSPPYAYLPHPALARRNMLVMDRVGIRASAGAPDRPGERTWRVAAPTVPPGPYAEEAIAGYVALTAPLHNNPRDVAFADRAEPMGLPPVVQREVATAGPAEPPPEPDGPDAPTP